MLQAAVKKGIEGTTVRHAPRTLSCSMSTQFLSASGTASANSSLRGAACRLVGAVRAVGGGG